MKSEGLTGEKMAMDLHVDASLVSRFKTGDRSMNQELAKESVHVYDNSFYSLEMTREFSDGQTAPRIDGTAIESTNRLAVMISAIKETKEALESINLERFIKSPEFADDNDLLAAEKMLKECKEAEWALANLCASIADTYYLPSKKISNDLTKKWVSSKIINKESYR